MVQSTQQKDLEDTYVLHVDISDALSERDKAYWRIKLT